MTTILLIPHVDAGDRSAWTDDQDIRPLSELGVRQAESLAAALVGRGISALYASPALRARQTLEPLGERLGLAVLIDGRLSEKQALESRAQMVARAWEALNHLADDNPGGTAAAASHGDLIPALAHYLATEHQAGSVPDVIRRGQWYEIEIDGDDVRIAFNEGPEDLPS